MTREEFIAKNEHFFWYIKKESIPNIGMKFWWNLFLILALGKT